MFESLLSHSTCFAFPGPEAPSADHSPGHQFKNHPRRLLREKNFQNIFRKYNKNKKLTAQGERIPEAQKGKVTQLVHKTASKHHQQSEKPQSQNDTNKIWYGA